MFGDVALIFESSAEEHKFSYLKRTNMQDIGTGGNNPLPQLSRLSPCFLAAIIFDGPPPVLPLKCVR